MILIGGNLHNTLTLLEKNIQQQLGLPKSVVEPPKPPEGIFSSGRQKEAIQKSRGSWRIILQGDQFQTQNMFLRS